MVLNAASVFLEAVISLPSPFYQRGPCWRPSQPSFSLFQPLVPFLLEGVEAPPQPVAYSPAPFSSDDSPRTREFQRAGQHLVVPALPFLGRPGKTLLLRQWLHQSVVRSQPRRTGLAILSPHTILVGRHQPLSQVSKQALGRKVLAELLLAVLAR